MNDDDAPYTPKLPTLMPPAAPSGIEGELGRFHRARTIRNPFAAMRHRVGEWSSRRALEASGKRFAALQETAERFTGAVEALGGAREAVMRYKVQGELTELRHDFAVQHAVTALHTEWNRDSEGLYKAQRDAIEAHNGVEAAIAFKETKFRLGQARAEAKIAETVELIDPVDEESEPAGDRVGQFRRLRDELRADGVDPDAIDGQIEPPPRKRRVPVR